MDTAVAFTQEYSGVSYLQRNMSTLSKGSGSSKDTHTSVGSEDKEDFLRFKT